MTLWTMPERSQLPFGPVWRALARHNYGVNHYATAQEWVIEVHRLDRVRGEYVRTLVCRHTSHDEIDVILRALPDLPGVCVRLALLAVLL